MEKFKEPGKRQVSKSVLKSVSYGGTNWSPHFSNRVSALKLNDVESISSSSLITTSTECEYSNNHTSSKFTKAFIIKFVLSFLLIGMSMFLFNLPNSLSVVFVKFVILFFVMYYIPITEWVMIQIMRLRSEFDFF